MKPEELADELERAHQAILDEAGGSGERAWRRARFGQVAEDNLPAILSALRDGEKMREALRIARSGINAAYAMAQAEYQNHDRIAERHDKTVQGAYAAISQALTGEA